MEKPVGGPETGAKPETNCGITGKAATRRASRTCSCGCTPAGQIWPWATHERPTRPDRGRFNAKRPRTLPASGSHASGQLRLGRSPSEGGERARAACPSSPWLLVLSAFLHRLPPDGPSGPGRRCSSPSCCPARLARDGRRTVQRTTSSTGWLPYAGTAAGAGPPQTSVLVLVDPLLPPTFHWLHQWAAEKGWASRVLLLGPIRFVGETVVGRHRSGHHRGEPRAAGVGAGPIRRASECWREAA